MRASTSILAISLLVPFAGVQAQGPPSLAQVLAQARQQESEVMPTVDFPLVISVPVTTFQTTERSHVLAVPTLAELPRWVEPNSPAALLWAPLRSGSRPTPAPKRLLGAATAVIMGAGMIVRAIVSLPPLHFTPDVSWLLSGCR